MSYALLHLNGGLAGASKDAPVSDKAGSSNLAKSTAMRLEPLTVGVKHFIGGCHHGYDPNLGTRVIYPPPFANTTDFTELADNCEQYAYSLVECDNITEKLALCGRLSACLALLQPKLNEPVPAHLIPHFTVDDLPSRLPAFEPESDQLAQYCQVLTQLLISRALPQEMAAVMESLLCELVSYCADTLKAPRWITTLEGNIAIN